MLVVKERERERASDEEAMFTPLRSPLRENKRALTPGARVKTINVGIAKEGKTKSVCKRQRERGDAKIRTKTRESERERMTGVSRGARLGHEKRYRMMVGTQASKEDMIRDDVQGRR